jgi:Putative Flp pilus-assembly TadE/G-like
MRMFPKLYLGHRRCLRRFARTETGYAFYLTLIALPLIMGFAVLVIDGSRVQNLHTDLQNAVDAMALTGARELDGRNDSIIRANAAIAELGQNEAWFGDGGAGFGFGSKIDVTYNAADDASSTVEVFFLTGIPGNQVTGGQQINGDDIPIDLEAYGTTDPNDATYAMVRAKPQSLVTMFPLPVGGRDTLNVAAEAVAVYRAAACDVTPIYICNPFEGDNLSFNEHFNQGDMYAREVELQNTGSSSPGPGNFGFLRTVGSGANVLSEALATGSPGVCYKEDGVDTEPGAQVGPVEQGINTRMGLYGGSFGRTDRDPRYRPDHNIRMGQSNPGAGNSCRGYNPEADPGEAMAFPPGDVVVTLPGGSISSATWDLDLYWHIAHDALENSPMVQNDDGDYVLPDDYVLPSAPSAVYGHKPTLPAGASVADTSPPSRYDVYTYELQNSMTVNQSPNGESGTPACHRNYNIEDYQGERRTIFSAVLNCNALNAEGILQGAATDVPTEAFALMFMTKPATAHGNDRALNLEMVDVTGEGGLGLLEEFLREEAELVR